MLSTLAFASPLALTLSADAAAMDTSAPTTATTTTATTASTTSAATTAPAIILSMAAPLPAEPITPQEAFTSLEGVWEGTLSYRDYQSNKMESIPVAVTMLLEPDGQTMVQRFDYTDPGFQVYVTNLITVKDGLLTGATARAGRVFETYEKDLTVTAQTLPQQWTLVMDDASNDDGRPARIRETMVRSEGTLNVLKEVDYLDDDKEEWIFRNEITLAAK
ncbi:MAG: hypothetical protein AAF559_05480 [Pseudomonadota bacterium]